MRSVPGELRRDVTRVGRPKAGPLVVCPFQRTDSSRCLSVSGDRDRLVEHVTDVLVVRRGGLEALNPRLNQVGDIAEAQRQHCRGVEQDRLGIAVDLILLILIGRLSALVDQVVKLLVAPLLVVVRAVAREQARQLVVRVREVCAPAVAADGVLAGLTLLEERGEVSTDELELLLGEAEVGAPLLGQVDDARQVAGVAVVAEGERTELGDRAAAWQPLTVGRGRIGLDAKLVKRSLSWQRGSAGSNG